MHDQVVAILGRFVPAEIALSIADYAEFWTQASFEKAEPTSVDEDSPREPYLSFAILHSKKLRKIVFETRSHDQGTPWHEGVRAFRRLTCFCPGFSWDRAHIGTYEGSWTWFEASIAGRDVPPRHIQSNVHANGEFRNHTNTWAVTDRTPDLQEWFDALRDGDEVEVYPMAQYGAWRNYVEFVKADVYYAIT